MNEGLKKCEKLLGLYLVEFLNICLIEKNWEFELGVCICIVLVYKKMYMFRECVEIKFVEKVVILDDFLREEELYKLKWCN